MANRLITFLVKKITARLKFLRSLSANHWRYLLRNLSAREINLILVWLGLAAAAALFLSGYDYWALRVTAPDQGGMYTEGLIGEPRYLNPVVSSANEVDRDITTLVLAGLVKHDGSGRIIPDLAAKYEIKDGGKTYEFTLRENLSWPDKKPFTADDVVFTINLIKDSKYQSPLRNNWQGVRVEKIDDRRLAIRLPVAYEPFLENATVGILPQHLWSGIQPQNFLLTQLNLKPVGLGPYMLSKITKNAAGLIRSMEFSPNPRYYEKANISRLVLRFYESQSNVINAYKRREIDGFSLSSVLEKDQLSTARSVNFYEIKLPRYFGVFFNQSKSAVLSELAVRQALTQATDRNFIVRELLKDEARPQSGPFPFGLLEIGESKNKLEYNPEKSQSILERAGWKIGSDGFREKKLKNSKASTRLEFVLTTTDWPELTQVSSALKSDWEKVGAKVNLDIVPVNAIQNQTIRPRQYEALLFGEVLGLNPDPFSFWHSTQRKDPGLNLALYSNKKADTLLETARQTSQSADRVKKYQDFQNILSSDAPTIFLYSPNYIYAVSKKIKNFDLKAVNTPSQRFENINKWYIATQRVKK